MTTVGLSLLAVGAGAGPSSAAELLSTTVSAPETAKRSCILRELSGGRGVATRSVRTTEAGWVTARLEASSGDWDLAVYDAASHEQVAASTFMGASEVATGLNGAGRRLTVQACRRSGGAKTATLEVETTAVDTDAKAVKTSIVHVSTPNRARRNELTELGVDLTEHGGDGFVGVVLHGAADAAKLRKSKFTYTTQIADLDAVTARDRQADARYDQRVRGSALPSARTSYRVLADYTMEMKQLAERNPGLVKSITLPFKTYEGRSVEGIEITENVNARDGKPVFVNMGVHHAREWPSGEHTMEWAYEMVNGFRANNPRVRDLLARARVIVVPIINPDGFNNSRTAGDPNARARSGRGAPNPDQENELVNIVSSPTGEYRRKNCRLIDDSPQGNCMAGFAAGLAASGVDPNRNYGGLWGGPGASEDRQNETYRGPGPFSEPETKNVKSLVSSRQVTTLITNHTFSDLILRPPGVQGLGDPPDENKGYKALADAMAAENGYSSQKGFELYDTTGTTEDWSYGATGGFGFTFEIGCVIPEVDDMDRRTGGCTEGHFHPPYSEVVKEYEGTTDRAKEVKGQGNREAYFVALESTANSARHSVIGGAAPEGVVLRLKKTFKTKTSPVFVGGTPTKVQEFADDLDTTMVAPGSGTFEWHLNPSTRPDVAKERGRPAAGPPSPAVSFAGSTAGPPVDGAAPSGDANSDIPVNYNDHPIVVPSNPGNDNAELTVKIEWQTPTSDWDMKLYRDSNGDGSSVGEAQVVGTSQTGPSDFEQITLGGDALAPGAKFVLRVNNFAAVEPYDGKVTFEGPETFVPAQKESWTLTCEAPDGKVASTQKVLIERGQRQSINFGSACASVAPAVVTVSSPNSSRRRRCLTTRGGVRATSLGPVKLARKRARQRRVLRTATRLSSRAGIDRYCSSLNGTVRVGYPTRRLMARIGSRSRRRVAKKAILAISTDRRYRLRGVRVNSSVRTLRKRLRGEKRFRVGKNVWYVATGKRSRLLFRTQRGKVRELGLGNKRLTASRRSTRLFLRAWDRRGL